MVACLDGRVGCHLVLAGAAIVWVGEAGEAISSAEYHCGRYGLPRVHQRAHWHCFTNNSLGGENLVKAVGNVFLTAAFFFRKGLLFWSLSIVLAWGFCAMMREE